MKIIKKIIKWLRYILIVLNLMFMSAACTFDATQNTQITMMLTGPKLSPSKNEIVFDYVWVRNNEAGEDIGILLIINNEIRMITEFGVDGRLNQAPTWSIDSKYVLYKSFKKDGEGLYLKNVKTLRDEVLITHKYDADEKYQESQYESPIWMSGNNKVVYIKHKYKKDTILSSGYLYDLVEHKEKKIIEGLSDTIAFGATWGISYDEKFIFYTKLTDKNNDIWIKDLKENQGDETKLTDGQNVVYLKASPVSNEMLYVTKDQNANNWKLYKLNTITRAEKVLYEGNYYLN